MLRSRRTEDAVRPDDLRELIRYLEGEVRLAAGSDRRIEFRVPDESTLLAARLHPVGVRRLLDAAWLAEMVADVRETPRFCDPGESADQVLRYARDVVSEYIRKRFPL
jgi:hypothetical protein